MAAPNTFPVVREQGNTHSSRVQDNINATLEPLSRALNATPIMGGSTPVWVKPNLTADFVVITGQAQPGYHRDALSYAHLKGTVSTAAGKAAGSTIFTLPDGYRPREPLRISVRGTAGAVQALVVAANGIVSNDVIIGAGGTIDLNVSFLVER